MEELFSNFAGLSLQKIITAVLVLLVCLIVVRIFMRLVDKALDKPNLEHNHKRFMRVAVKALLYVLTALTVASTLGIPITSLVAVLSVLGLAVSLAAQNSLANLAGGIMLIATHPFKSGDFIEAGGISGAVVEVGLAYTRIKTADNKLIFVPNSSISNDKITNYTAESIRRVDIEVGASYDNSIQQVRQALQAALDSQTTLLADPAPFINVSSYEDSCIKYALRCWVHTEDYWDTYFALLEEVKHSFEAHGVQMTYNHLNVHVLQNANSAAEA